MKIKTLILAGLLLCCTLPARAGVFDQALKAWQEDRQTEARTLFLKAAQEGDARAMNYLGYIAAEGLAGQEKNAKVAEEWYRKGMAKQNGDSAYNLFLLLAAGGHDEESAQALTKAADLGHEKAAQELYNKLLQQGKTKEAKERFDKSFNRGQAWALTNRAMELINGSESDRAKAVALLEPMAKKGDLSAEYLLGNVALDQGKAVSAQGHYLKAAQGGYVPAMYGLGMSLLASDQAEAVEWLGKAAEQGFGPATVALGQLYEQGGQGMPGNPADAVALYEKGVQVGDPLSQISMGRLYETGTGVQKNPAKAAELYQQAAQNHPQGKYHLARLYYLGLGVKQDQKKALALLRQAADDGEAQAMTDLGLYVYTGSRGAKKNEAEGMKLLEKAAKAGSSAAAVNLARILLAEEKRDLPRITALLSDAAKDGDPSAQVLMGRMAEESDEEGSTEQAREWYQKAAGSGDPEAEYVLATFLMEYDEKANPRQIVSLLGKAAAKGHALANFTLGRLFEQGQYVAANRDRALQFYTAAAESGDAGAQTQLATLLLEGDELHAADPAAAAKWYQAAGDQDYPVALTGLARLYATGVGVSRDLKKAADLYRRAAELGNPQGQYNLGRMMLVGLGMWKDQKGGLEWIRKAADQGYGPAQNQLGVLYSQGAEGLPHAPYDALSWFLGAANQGYLTAQYNLGLLYAGGELGNTYEQAREWLCLAASQNHAQAAYELARLYDQGKGGTVDKPVALWWAQKAESWGFAGATAFVAQLEREVPQEQRLTVPPPCEVSLSAPSMQEPDEADDGTDDSTEGDDSQGQGE